MLEFLIRDGYVDALIMVITLGFPDMSSSKSESSKNTLPTFAAITYIFESFFIQTFVVKVDFPTVTVLSSPPRPPEYLFSKISD